MKFKVSIAVLGLATIGFACAPSKFGADNGSDGPSQSVGTPIPGLPPRAIAGLNACAYAKKVFGVLGTQLGPNASITNVIGSVIYGATQLQSITDIKGSIIIVGTGAGGTINLVGDVDGSVIVCGMNVNSVAPLIRGSVIVVDGNVGSVDGVIGSLLVLDGQINGSISNSIGSVLALRTK